MFKRILVPLDGSPRAERALSVAVGLARVSGGSLVLLRVVDTSPEHLPPVSAKPNPFEAIGEADRIQAESYLTGVANSEPLTGISVETLTPFGLVAPTILSTAVSQHADVIVLCSHGYTGFKRWVLGSVAERVIRYAPVPVLVLRESGPLPTAVRSASERPLRALVALDGSAFAETALEPAAQMVAALAAPTQGALHLLRVVDIPDRYGIGKSQANIGMEMIEQARQEANIYLISVIDQLQTGIAARLNLSLSASVVSNSDVAGAIIKAGESVEENGWYALMALSTHGRGGLERWMMGSITERVLHGTRLPLLIVRPPATRTKKEVAESQMGASAKSDGQSWVGLL